MKRAFLSAIGSLVIIILISPVLIYWWGLSVLDSYPVPSSQLLSPDQEREMWNKAMEIGEPRVRGVNPYSYLIYLKCSFAKGVNDSECLERFPGLRAGAFAVRTQVAEALQAKDRGLWPISWMAYTIWASQNWDIHQILATYYFYSEPHT